jgi:hypothetical protein
LLPLALPALGAVPLPSLDATAVVAWFLCDVKNVVGRGPSIHIGSHVNVPI